MKPRKPTSKWATDHRALVLEAVATSPMGATLQTVTTDCVGPDFKAKNVGSMLYQLVREGLIGRAEDGKFFVTKAGLEWLTTGRFDRALPAYAERPRARKQRT